MNNPSEGYRDGALRLPLGQRRLAVVQNNTLLGLGLGLGLGLTLTRGLWYTFIQLRSQCIHFNLQRAQLLLLGIRQRLSFALVLLKIIQLDLCVRQLLLQNITADERGFQVLL